MTVDDQFEKALRSPKPTNGLRALALALAAEGLDQDALLDVFEKTPPSCVSRIEKRTKTQSWISSSAGAARQPDSRSIRKPPRRFHRPSETANRPKRQTPPFLALTVEIQTSCLARTIMPAPRCRRFTVLDGMARRRDGGRLWIGLSMRRNRSTSSTMRSSLIAGRKSSRQTSRVAHFSGKRIGCFTASSINWPWSCCRSHFPGRSPSSAFGCDNLVRHGDDWYISQVSPRPPWSSCGLGHVPRRALLIAGTSDLGRGVRPHLGMTLISFAIGVSLKINR